MDVKLSTLVLTHTGTRRFTEFLFGHSSVFCLLADEAQTSQTLLDHI